MSFMLLGILNAQATGGGAGAFDLLETTTLTSSASSVTFSGLDAYSDYKHLQIRMVAKSVYGGGDVLSFNLNGDTGSNYAYHYLRGTGSAVQSNDGVSTSTPWIATLPGSTADSDSFGAIVLDILDFSSANKNTTLRALSGSTSGSVQIGLYSGLWNNTNAVTSVSLFPNSFGFTRNLVTGSRFSLYGVK